MSTVNQADTVHAGASPAPGLPAPEKVRRILVCQQRQIGDVLLSTPAVKLLSGRYPEAEIHFFTEDKCAPMLENNPHVHQIRALGKFELSGRLAQLDFYRRLGRDNFDLLVNFQHLPRCTWVAAFSNARVRLASDSVWYARFFYTHLAKLSGVYAAARKAGTLLPLGIAWRGERPRLYLTGAERAGGRELLEALGLSGKRFVTVDATHKDIYRLWPARHFAALMDMTAAAVPDAHFLLVHGPGEGAYVRELAGMAACKERLRMPPEVRPLRQVAACMEHAALHLGTCSAPRHMAVALDVPTFVISDDRGPLWTFPSDEHACVKLSDFDGAAPSGYSLENMAGLTPDLVFPRFMEHLARYGKH